MLLPALGLSLLTIAATSTTPAATTTTTTTTTPATTTATAAQRLLVLDLAAVGVDDNAVRTITGVVSSLVDECSGVEAVTGADMRTMSAITAEQQRVGCDESSCLGELANALGARYVVSGDVGRLGERYVVNLSLFDSEQATSAGRRTVEVNSLETVSSELRPAVNELLAPLGGIPLASGGGSVLVPVGGAALGVGLAAVGVGVGLAFVNDGVASDTSQTVEEKTDAIGAGRLWLGAAVVGGVVAVAGAGVLVAGRLSE